MKIKSAIKHFGNLLFALGFCSSVFAQNGYPYMDPKNTIAVRVNDLISRMTIEEKVNQLRSQLLFLPDYDKRDFSLGHVRNIGHFMHQNASQPVTAGACAEAINEDTRKSIAANRWGIPVLQHGEALHGAQWGQATCFPQSIGMAASFDDELYFREGQVVAKELRAVGVRQVYAPVINISRDPRWGRTEESYGEDVFLTSRMGVAWVKALQQGGIVATPKHFVDNYADGGHDSYASANSWRILYETFLEPFRVCIQEGGAESIMAAYNSLDGIPCTSNSVLLKDILCREWGFKGYVVSDYSGVKGVHSAHHVAKNYAEAQALSLEAGLDVELSNGYPDLLQLVKSGRITENQIDESLRKVLTCKFNLGLFEAPFVDSNQANKVVRSEEHRKLALEAAEKTITLLKNNKNTLPLSDKLVKRIGVFGPAADVLSLGDYSGPYGGWKGAGAVNPYEGLLARLKGKAEVVLHKPGEDITMLAKQCDAVIFFGAIREGEGHDRSLMGLPSRTVKVARSLDHAQIVDGSDQGTIIVDQEKMIKELAASGIKTIVVLQNGSPVDIRSWIDDVDALIEAWYPGEQGGTAIAAALFGDINPGGRLPISWPCHGGQIPVYYAIKPSGRGYDYNDDDGKPMFPFGYGLSYTRFEYSELMLPDKVSKDEPVQIKVKVRNTGLVTGDEVIQVYIHDELASVVRPLTELKAYKRITLNPGESRQVTLTIPYRHFGFYDKNMKYIYEPGNYRIYVSKDAENKLLEGSVEIL